MSMEQKDWNKMTVAQLKDVLAGKGLPTDGKKADLIERLTKASEEELLAEGDASTGGPILDEEKILEDLSSPAKEEITAPTTSPKKTIEAPETGASGKKESVVGDEKFKARAARFGLPIGEISNKNGNGSPATSTPAVSGNDAKSARAIRFGLDDLTPSTPTSASRAAVSEDQKSTLMKRAARFGIPVSAEGKRLHTEGGADAEKLASRAARFGGNANPTIEADLKKKARLERFGGAV